MASIRVPQQVFEGFKIISNLDESQIDLLRNYLKNLDVGRFYGDVANDLSDILNINGDELLQTILSFVELTSENDVDIEILSKNLSYSYNLLSKSNLNTKKLNKLISNLYEILTNYNKINIAEKIREHKVENSNNLRTFKFFTDVRIVPTNIDVENNYGIILHRLLLEYQNSNPKNELYLSLDIDDLHKLKAEVEIAIEKDMLLRESGISDLNLI